MVSFAAHIGPSTTTLIEIIMRTKPHPEQTIVTSQIPVDHWHEVIGDPPSPTPCSTDLFTTPIASC